MGYKILLVLLFAFSGTVNAAKKECCVCLFKNDAFGGREMNCSEQKTREACHEDGKFVHEGIELSDCNWNNVTRTCSNSFKESCDEFAKDCTLSFVDPLQGVDEDFFKHKQLQACKKIDLHYSGHGKGYLKTIKWVEACAQAYSCDIQSTNQACSTFKEFGTDYENTILPVLNALSSHVKENQTVCIEGNQCIATPEITSKITFKLKKDQVEFQLEPCHSEETECAFPLFGERFDCLADQKHSFQTCCLGDWVLNRACNEKEILNQKLVAAIVAEDVNAVRSQISAGADVNAIWKGFGNSMHFAAMVGNSAVTTELIKAKSDLNTKGAVESTPLHTAAAEGKSANLLVMVRAGADLNAKNKYGNTPLHVAAIKGQVSSIRALLSVRADKEATNNTGDTALAVAAATNQVEAINALLAMGSNLKAKNLNGRNALHLAAGQNAAQAIRALLLAGADPNEKDNGGLTPLDLAKKFKKINAIRALTRASVKKETQSKIAQVGSLEKWVKQQSEITLPSGNKVVLGKEKGLLAKMRSIKFVIDGKETKMSLKLKDIPVLMDCLLLDGRFDKSERSDGKSAEFAFVGDFTNGIVRVENQYLKAFEALLEQR